MDALWMIAAPVFADAGAIKNRIHPEILPADGRCRHF